MNVVINLALLVLSFGVLWLSLRFLQRLFPVGYLRSVLWGFKNGKYILAPISVLLLLLSSLFVMFSLNMHTTLLFGSEKGVLVQGRTMSKILAFDPKEPESGLKEYGMPPFSLSSPALYPGQTFTEAVEGIVLIKAPYEDEYNVLFTGLLPYVMIHLVILMLLSGALVANGFLLAYHAAGEKVIEKLPRRGDLSAYFKERMGISLGKAVFFLCAVFVASAVFDAFVSMKYGPAFDAVAEEEKSLEKEMLSRVKPGTVLKGKVAERETFAVTRETERSRQRRRGPSTTVTNRYVVYLIRFDDILPLPVYVSMVYHENDSRPEFRKMMDVLDKLLGSESEGEFTVNEDYSIQMMGFAQSAGLEKRANELYERIREERAARRRQIFTRDGPPCPGLGGMYAN